MTSVTEDYSKVLDAWKNAEAQTPRPPAGEYNLALYGVSVKQDKDTTFRYTVNKGQPDEKQISVPGICVTFQWHLDEDPVTHKPSTFGGRWWTIPLLDPNEIAELPSGQQTRVDIAWGQLKTNIIRLIGYEPEDPFEAMRGFHAHLQEMKDKGTPVMAHVRIKNRKKEPEKFDSDIVIRLIDGQTG